MRVALLSACCLAVASPAALAQSAGADPAAAIEGFLTDSALLGAETATVGAVSTEGDTVTAESVEMEWSTTIESMGETVTLHLTAEVPSLTVKGLTEVGEGHSVAALDIPALTLSFYAEGAPEPFSYVLKVENYSMVDASWGAFPRIAADPEAPVSRFAPLIDWAVAQSYQRSGADKVSGTLTAGEETQEVSYGPAFFGPVENGKLASFEYGPFKVSQAGEMPMPDGTVSPIEIVVDYGRILGKGVDLKPLAQLFTGNGGATGAQPILESLEFDGLTVTAEDKVDVRLGGATSRNLSIDPTRGPLLKKLDPLVLAGLAGTPPPPEALVSTLLDLYGAYGVELYEINDISVTTPEGKGSLAQIVMEDLSSAGMKRFAIEDGMVDGIDGSGTLGLVEVRDVLFPPREKFVALVVNGMNGMPFDPSDLGGMPTMGGFSLKGISADIGNGDAPFELGLFDISLSDFVAAIPTKIAVALEGLQMPLSMVQHPMAQMVLSAVGANPVTADAKLTLGYDEATKSVALDSNADVGKVGALTAKAELTGIPKVVFENPMRANEAVATAALGGLTLSFDDAGITGFLVGMMSEQAGISAAEFAEGMAQQVALQIAIMTGDDDLAQQLSDTVEAYLSDPRSLAVRAAPAAAVPFAQIIGAAMAAPAQIPALLNLTVTANE